MRGPIPLPKRASRMAALAVVAAALLAPAPALAQEDPAWAAVALPSAGAAQSIGGFTNGCIAGAVALPPEGPGYQVIRLSRNRNWGHPDLVAFIQRLGRAADAAGLPPILIGDIGQPRGGPITGHASHEIGLDVDIWLRLDLPLLPREAREQLEPYEVVGAWEDVVRPGALTPAHAALIRFAASDPRVGRVLVHPAIKRALCEMPWEDRGWLRTVRPWTGHNEHFHVRLACPADSPLCVDQAPPPEGDGCAEAMTWFPMRPPVPDPNAPPPPPPPPLPAACTAVLSAP